MAKITIPLKKIFDNVTNREPHYSRDLVWTQGVPETVLPDHVLPDGYTIDSLDQICDPNGYVCEIVYDCKVNGPVLMSLAGPCGDAPLVLA